MPRDIEEFLKMAAKRRQQQKKQGGRPATPAAGGAQQRATPPPPRQTARPATDDEIVIIGGSVAPAPDPYNQSVAEHVRSHIDTSDLVQHARELGGEVALADDKLDARLHDTFDHKVGSLKTDLSRSIQSTTTTTTAKVVAPIANDLLEMLSNPESIRQAILISEVLKRPNFD